jgi:hypothetical protein
LRIGGSGGNSSALPRCRHSLAASSSAAQFYRNDEFQPALAIGGFDLLLADRAQGAVCAWREVLVRR